MKKTMKKRAFVVAMIMLMVTTIALTSSTFAWFTMADTVDVEAMDLTVTSIEGVQISANAETWTANLTIDEIFDINPEQTSRYDAWAGNTNIYPNKNLTPVSSAFATADNSTGFANFYKSAISGGATTANVTAVAQNKEAPAGFIAFDLFFKVDKEDPNAVERIYFNESEFKDVSDEEGVSQNALSALRVAFTPLGTVASTATPEEATALNSFAAGDTVSYEVDSLHRSADAAKRLSEGAQPTEYLNSTGNGIPAENGILDAGVAINGKAVDDQDASTDKYFELPVGISKVRVYIWMEGQDVDCLNSVAGSSLAADLKFTIE